MTVYVDDAGISATVRNQWTHRDIASTWSHLTADTQDELHEFAVGKLRLRRDYFQPGKALADGRPSPLWHYDVTAGKRQQALRHGAVAVGRSELFDIIREREARARGPLEAMLREFHGRFGPAAPLRAGAIADPWLLALRRRLLDDEVTELHEAIASGDAVEIGREAADVIYVAAGTAVAAGLPIDQILAAVHRANMTKDPGPDGKAVKGAAYEAADVAEVIRRSWP